MKSLNLRSRAWWNYLTEGQRDLLGQSEILIEREEKIGGDLFDDYSFLVFPAAKAYEGFLKKLLFDLGMITKKQYFSDHFRIGRSLNPSLPKRLRDPDWVYLKLSEFCQDRNLAQKLWSAWKEARNLLFHWFPHHENFITLDRAKERVMMIINGIEESFKSCNLKVK